MSATSTSARRRGWKLIPSTAARRTTAPSRGSSASIRAIVAAPTLSGSSSRSPAAAAASRSSRNSGLPPERSTASSSTCGGTCARFRRRQRQRVRRPRRQWTELDPRSGHSRRATGRRRRRAASTSRPTRTTRARPPDASNSAADAASIRWACSTSTIVGHDQRPARGTEHDLAQLGGARLGGQLVDLGGARDLDVDHDRDQRQPRQSGPGWLLRISASSRSTHALLGVVPFDPEQLTQQVPPDEVRRLARDHLARRVQHAHALAQLPRLGQQARLPDSRSRRRARSTAPAPRRAARSPRADDRRARARDRPGQPRPSGRLRSTRTEARPDVPRLHGTWPCLSRMNGPTSVCRNRSGDLPQDVPRGSRRDRSAPCPSRARPG